MKVWLFVAALVALLVAAFTLPLGQWLTALLAWIDANPGVSWLAFFAAYVTATVLMAPGSPLTLGAGFVFGLPVGFALVSVSSVVGASCAFLVGRYALRDWVEERLADTPRFAALDRAVGERGWLIVLLTRLSPLFPFNLLNYALGLTSVKFWHYVLASWIGMMPGTVLYVYFGSAAQDLALLLSGEGPDSPWLLYVGLAATLVLTIVITRVATRALRGRLDEGAGEETA